jgi:hypothetical protein
MTMEPTKQSVIYVPKEELYPLFGSYSSDGTIKIRADLPPCVQAFLLDHEEHHRADTEVGEFWGIKELEANWCATWRHPWGALVTIVLSLAPARLRYYRQRIKEKK